MPSLSALTWHPSRPCAFWLAHLIFPLRHLLGPCASATVPNVRSPTSAAAPMMAHFETDLMIFPPCVACGSSLCPRKGVAGRDFIALLGRHRRWVRDLD